MTPKNLVIIDDVLQTMSNQMMDHPGAEVCGLLGGVGDRASIALPIPNVADHPMMRFVMEPQAQVDGMLFIENLGSELVGIYHSHPKGSRPDPSPSDIDAWAYPDVVCLILLRGEDNSMSNLRAFRIKNTRVEDIPIVMSSESPE